MLCYAWDFPNRMNKLSFGSEKFDHIYNLFARVYIYELNSLIKRGLHKDYRVEKEELATIKGKMMLEDSIKAQTMLRGRIICQYDHFSGNIELNQIIKTTITLLLMAPQLDRELQKKLVKLRVYFSDIKEIELSQSLFSSLRFNRNNSHYRMLIHISELLARGLIVNDKQNNRLFADFFVEDQMARLFEKFVLSFYRVHLNSEIYKAHAPKLKWRLDRDMSREELSLLPEMRTDIVVENKKEETQLIIDTKYYAQTLVTSNWTDSEKVRTSHLFQIFAYINNSNYRGAINGMLLYPTTVKEVDAVFPMGGKCIYIKTLNLNAEWEEISGRLLSFVT